MNKEDELSRAVTLKFIKELYTTEETLYAMTEVLKELDIYDDVIRLTKTKLAQRDLSLKM